MPESGIVLCWILGGVWSKKGVRGKQTTKEAIKEGEESTGGIENSKGSPQKDRTVLGCRATRCGRTLMPDRLAKAWSECLITTCL